MATQLSTPPSSEPKKRDVSIRGGVESCACPDCGGPMSIRRWLGVAECFRCGTSIELEYVLRQPKSRKSASPRQKSESGAAGKAAKAKHSTEETRETTARKSSRSTAPPAVPVDAIEIGLAAPPISRRIERVWRQLNQLLACLASVIAHLLLLLLLALLTWTTAGEPDDFIELSIDLREDQREQALVVDEQLQPIGYEMSEPTDIPPEQLANAEQLAEELQMGPSEPAPNLPPLSRITENLNSDDDRRRMLSARDPRIRREVIRNEGGTTLTEAAVARALRWMARHQADNGSWPLDDFNRCGDCSGQCSGSGLKSDTGGTGLVLLAMLGAGQSHRAGMYQQEVSHGLQFLLSQQKQTGDLRSTGHRSGNSGMYVQAIAALALCDAYALTGDETLRQPAQRSIDFIIDAQAKGGGWRYQPRDRGDLSVTGWQLMAMHSARAGGLEVPMSSLAQASVFLDRVQADRIGARYSYVPGQAPSPAMTAEGLLSRMYLGKRRNDPGMARGVEWLVNDHRPDARRLNIYHIYYATQVMHHWGGDEWRVWNRSMQDALVSTQVTAGHAEGSWDPKTPHGGQGGRLYMTVLACCTLEVYYRHAPLFRKINLGR